MMNTFRTFVPMQQLFVYEMPRGEGYGSIGFKNAQDRVRRVAQWVGFVVPEITPDRDGFDTYQAVMRIGEVYAAETGNRCGAELILELVGAEGKRVEVEEQDGTKHRFWVGKSTGWMPCHLEKKHQSSPDGEPVSGAPFKSVRILK